LQKARFTNIDAQDESFLHQEPVPAVIVCGFADARGLQASRFLKKSCASCASMFFAF
jgi:hypothetical protein